MAIQAMPQFPGFYRTEPYQDLAVINKFIHLSKCEVTWRDELHPVISAAVVNGEISHFLSKDIQALFDNDRAFSFPLTMGQLSLMEIGLLRWLLLSFGGIPLWNVFTDKVLSHLSSIKTLLKVDLKLLSDIQISELEEDLQHYANLLLDQQDFDYYGGPVTEGERMYKDRTTVVVRNVMAVVSNFTLENWGKLIRSPLELNRDVLLVLHALRHKVMELNEVPLILKDPPTCSEGGCPEEGIGPSSSRLVYQNAVEKGEVILNRGIVFLLSVDAVTKISEKVGRMNETLERFVKESKEIKAKLRLKEGSTRDLRATVEDVEEDE